ncbi:hypothetical protein F4819DRAFT_22089 [Hypoxylon fuscum]|nr:hypothetical protein F4819DRAFT_22089 [Hypoxylon fuscum]
MPSHRQNSERDTKGKGRLHRQESSFSTSSNSDNEPKKSPSLLRSLFRHKSEKRRSPSPEPISTSQLPLERSTSRYVSSSSFNPLLRAPTPPPSPSWATTSEVMKAVHESLERDYQDSLHLTFQQISDTHSGPPILQRHGAVHRARPVQGQGTRGLFIPTYGSPRHFSQVERLRNPRIRRVKDPARLGSQDGSVVVRFYHCKRLYLSQGFKFYPGVDDLVSAASAFLGYSHLRDGEWPALPAEDRNPGYVGFNEAQAHGGFHLHYPDCAGLTPFEAEIAGDWEQVMQAHRHYYHDDFLLVAVGLGKPGECCLKARTHQQMS